MKLNDRQLKLLVIMFVICLGFALACVPTSFVAPAGTNFAKSEKQRWSWAGTWQVREGGQFAKTEQTDNQISYTYLRTNCSGDIIGNTAHLTCANRISYTFTMSDDGRYFRRVSARTGVSSVHKRVGNPVALRGSSAERKVAADRADIQPPEKEVRSDVDEIPAAAVNRKNDKAYAIVIGIENYRQKLPKADFAAQDARTVTEYLTKTMGYAEENVITLLNDHAAKSDFEKYFEKWLHNNVEKNSTVFIYYSGHGAPSTKTGDAFIVPYDGDPSFIDQTGYSLNRMYDALGKLPAKEIIVALDSCFSGAGGRSVVAKGSRPLVINLQGKTALPDNMTVLSASSGEQTSSTYDEKGHGLFTYFLLKGIKNEDVLKQDGSLAVSDLFSYLKPQVERIARKQYNNEQTPQLISPKRQ